MEHYCQYPQVEVQAVLTGTENKARSHQVITQVLPSDTDCLDNHGARH
jgi:hypothetical protein